MLNDSSMFNLPHFSIFLMSDLYDLVKKRSCSQNIVIIISKSYIRPINLGKKCLNILNIVKKTGSCCIDYNKDCQNRII